MGGGNVGEGVLVDLTGLARRLEVDPAERPRADQRQHHAGRAERRRRPARASACRRIPPAGDGPRWAAWSPPTPRAPARCATAACGAGCDAVELVTARRARFSVLRRGGGSGDGSVETARRFETELAPVIRDAAPPDRRPLSPHPQELLGLRARRLARERRPARPDRRRRRHAGPRRRRGVGGWTRSRATAPALRVELRSLDDLVKAVAALHGAEPSAIELLDRTFLELVSRTVEGEGLARAEAILLVELERADAGDLARGGGRRGRGGAADRRVGGDGAESDLGGPALGAASRREPDPGRAPGDTGDRSRWWRMAASRWSGPGTTFARCGRLPHLAASRR